MSESFEDALIFAQAIMYDCDIPLLDRLQRAHEREIVEALCDACDQCDHMDKKVHEHEMEAEYARGHEDGRRSMDAEHAAVALRLRRLPLDGDTTENLSQIAKAVWHSDFGWEHGACRALRDELVRLLGGVRERPYPTSTYDVLGNERYKAVCRLLEVNTDACGLVRALASAIGVKWQAPRVTQTLAEVRDRLIYLLGGAYKSPMEYISDIVDEYERTHGKIGIELDGAGLSRKSVEAMSRRANLPESVESAKSDAEDGGEIGRITDELRECVASASKSHDRCISEAELLEIADRIDEQFDRICQQHEDVLQSTIDTMVDECEELQRELEYTKKSLGGMREQREHWADEAIVMFRAFFPHDEYCVPNSPSKMVIPKINEMQKKLDELEKFDQDTSLAAFGDDNDELRKLLSRAAKLLDNAEQDRDANYANWMDCKAKVVQANATIDELQAKLDEAEFAIANWREREMSFDASERMREELRMERDELRERLDHVAAALRGVERGTMSAWEAEESVRGSSN